MMKNFFYSVLMLATSMGFVACSNEEPLVDAPTEQTMIIGASIGESDTRTYLDENFKVRWSEWDNISLRSSTNTGIYGTFRLLADYAGQTYGKFTGSIFRFAAGYYDAYYGVSNNYIIQNQIYKPGTLSVSPMHAKIYLSNSTQIPTCEFKNLGGLLKVKIKNDKGEKIERIKISADQPLSGTFDIVEDAAVIRQSGSYKFIQYTIQGGLELTPEGTDIFIAIPAGNYTNVSIEMESTKGGISTKSLNGKTLSIERSKITPATFSVAFVNPEFEECVDLGLPSGKKWASCNLGAVTPWKGGIYYFWGSTIGEDGSDDWYEKELEKLLDYDTWQPLKYNETDGKLTLDLEDDAAYVNTGGKFKIPSPEDFKELKENCYWVPTDNYLGHDVYGYIVYRAKSESDKGVILEDESEASPEYSLSDTHIYIECGEYPTSSVIEEDRENIYGVIIEWGWVELDWRSYRFDPRIIRPIAVE